MEFVITIGLVAAGIVTRNIVKNTKAALNPVGWVGGGPLQQRDGQGGGEGE